MEIESVCYSRFCKGLATPGNDIFDGRFPVTQNRTKPQILWNTLFADCLISY